MSLQSRGAEELNDLISRLDHLIVTLASAQAEVSNDDGADVDGDQFDEVSQVEKEIRRKLMEIHSRLKNNANYLNFGDEESFFDDGEQGESDENLSRAERRRKVSSQQQQNIAALPESDENRDASHSPQMFPMSAVNSSAATSSNRSAILTTERATDLLRLCKIVFGCDFVNANVDGGNPKKISFTDESKALSAQLVAEMARSDMGRQLSLQEGIIAAVGLVLQGDKEPTVENDENEGANDKTAKRKKESRCSLETAVQVCRILGNLCYDCPEGRSQVLSQEQSLENLSRLARDREERAQEDPGQRLPVILPGFLLNLCNGTPTAVEVVGRLGFVEVIVRNILSTKTNDAVFNASLNWLFCLSEEIESSKSHILNSQDLPSALGHILEYTTSPEVAQTVLELVRALVDCPTLALHMIKKSRLFETLLIHVEKWKSSSEFELLRSDSCELLVLFLSHDECMKELYSEPQKKYLLTFIDWLALNEDPSLQVSAALALGNFACNETISMELINNQSNLIDKLISLLAERQNPANDFKLQHALLGALRNFAVTSQARRFLIDKGILSPCISLLERLNLSTPAYGAVIFKLLGTLRLLVEGNTDVVVRLIDTTQNQDGVSKLVTWGSTPESPQGIRAECGRLLAALIKNCRSRDSLRAVVLVGGLPPVNLMLHSSHVRMINEALLALAVLAATLAADSDDDDDDAVLIHRHLHIDLVINGIKRCICPEEGSGLEIPPEVKLNALRLLEFLLKVKTEEFKQMLLDLNFVQDCLSEESLKSLPPEFSRLEKMLKN